MRSVRFGYFSVILFVFAASAAAQAPGEAGHFYRSLHGLHVAGYQGWFTCPGDGSELGWGRWVRRGQQAQGLDALAVDMWPDTSELEPDELCPTGLRLPSGGQAFLFSDQNPKTVARHFRWMRQYGIDAAAMQRFVGALAKPATKQHLDAVLRNARAAAEANGRGFFVMYDVTGIDGAAALQAIANDWLHLAGDLRLTESSGYVFHRGKPVIAVWGLGFKSRNVTAAEAAAIIARLKGGAVPAVVLGGVPTSWRDPGVDGRWSDARSEPEWGPVYRSLDVISPWSVGRFNNTAGADGFTRLRTIPDLAATRAAGIGYMPVVFPGFSWSNGGGRVRAAPINSIPRRCGEFYRYQIGNAIRAGADMLFTAMFDELNEGTAIFKTVASRTQQPVGPALLALDADGCGQPQSDMYLRLAGEATRSLPGGR